MNENKILRVKMFYMFYQTDVNISLERRIRRFLELVFHTKVVRNIRKYYNTAPMGGRLFPTTSESPKNAKQNGVAAKSL